VIDFKHVSYLVESDEIETLEKDELVRIVREMFLALDLMTDALAFISIESCPVTSREFADDALRTVGLGK
jgi:hypothetical protein